MPSLDVAILVVSVVANGILGTFVLRASQKSRSTWLFLWMVACIEAWTIANFAIDASTSAAAALAWTRLLFVFGLGYITLFFFFARSFSPISPLPIRKSESVVAMFAVFTLLATLGSTWVFGNASTDAHGLETLEFGPLYLPLTVIGLGIVCVSIAELAYKAYRAGRTVVRDQIVIVISGWALFLFGVLVVGTVLPYFVPAWVNASKIVPLFSVPMVAACTYSICKHRFLDTTRIIQRGIIYSLSLGTILGVYIFLLFALDAFFAAEKLTDAFLSGAGAVAIGLVSAPHIERYFRRLTDRYFFKNHYEYAEVLEALTTTLSQSLQRTRIIRDSIRIVTRALRPERMIYVHKLDKSLLGSSGKMREVPTTPPDALVVPVRNRSRLIGEFILWPKQSGDPYTPEDQALLRTFAAQAGIALEKALLYERLQNHSRTLEETVQKRTAHLEALRAEQRAFMDDVSHALQTPLTVLKSSLERIADDEPDVRAHRRDLSLRSIDDLSGMIRNLLTLARVDAIPTETQDQIFDLSDTLQRIAEYVAVICEDQSIVFSTDISPRIFMRGISTQIEEAVTNILSNAVRYTANQEKREITLRVHKRGRWVRISVQDTGIGIAADKVPQVFERFYRAQSTQGSGLGLAITKRIIERHGGTIELASELGVGTTVTIQLPVSARRG